ncbi:MAG TPA: response regulator [Vicinamibacterales bacterium]|nr:response regulator [Vicinamibacterales bacterium]
MSSRQILLVEDNADDAELAIRAFRSANATDGITVARDGTEAVDVLLGSPATASPQQLPSLVLLDLKLPGVDGFQVLRRIRAHPRTRFLPVVVLTSSNELSDLAAAYRLGANSYVRKPISFRDFLVTAKLIGDYWLSLNEIPPAGLTEREAGVSS